MLASKPRWTGAASATSALAAPSGRSPSFPWSCPGRALSSSISPSTSRWKPSVACTAVPSNSSRACPAVAGVAMTSIIIGRRSQAPARNRRLAKQEKQDPMCRRTRPEHRKLDKDSRPTLRRDGAVVGATLGGQHSARAFADLLFSAFWVSNSVLSRPCHRQDLGVRLGVRSHHAFRVLPPQLPLQCVKRSGRGKPCAGSAPLLVGALGLVLDDQSVQLFQGGVRISNHGVVGAADRSR